LGGSTRGTRASPGQGSGAATRAEGPSSKGGSGRVRANRSAQGGDAGRCLGSTSAGATTPPETGPGANWGRWPARVRRIAGRASRGPTSAEGGRAWTGDKGAAVRGASGGARVGSAARSRAGGCAGTANGAGSGSPRGRSIARANCLDSSSIPSSITISSSGPIGLRGPPAGWGRGPTGWGVSNTCRRAGTVHPSMRHVSQILRPFGWFDPRTILIQPAAWRAARAVRTVCSPFFAKA
jgi:hypothetical protein